jgi:hypothetical protein
VTRWLPKAEGARPRHESRARAAAGSCRAGRSLVPRLGAQAFLPVARDLVSPGHQDRHSFAQHLVRPFGPPRCRPTAPEGDDPDLVAVHGEILAEREARDAHRKDGRRGWFPGVSGMGGAPTGWGRAAARVARAAGG